MMKIKELAAEWKKEWQRMGFCSSDTEAARVLKAIENAEEVENMATPGGYYLFFPNKPQSLLEAAKAHFKALKLAGIDSSKTAQDLRAAIEQVEGK